MHTSTAMLVLDIPLGPAAVGVFGIILLVRAVKHSVGNMGCTLNIVATKRLSDMDTVKYRVNLGTCLLYTSDAADE